MRIGLASYRSKNKDGKLSGMETVFRDAYHFEMAEKWDKNKKTK